MWTEAFETEKTRGISVKLSKGLVSFQEKRCISVKRKRERESNIWAPNGVAMRVRMRRSELLRKERDVLRENDDLAAGRFRLPSKVETCGVGKCLGFSPRFA